MSSPLRKHSGAVLLSVALHAGIVAALAVGIDFSRTPRPVQILAIEAMVVDEALLARVEQQQAEAEQQRLAEERAREEAERRAREEEQRRLVAEREAAELAERERQAAEVRQQQEAEQRRRDEEARLVEQRRQEDEARLRAEQEAAERERAAEEAERQRAEEEARQARLREEDERRRREEEERRRREEAERRLQAELEAELQQAADAEADRLAAMRSGALDQYIALITNRIQQNWNRPASARPGIDCTVQVAQIPGGEVVSARVVNCNGDDAVVRSIETAVLRASPLPIPEPSSLFQRNLNIRFVPDE